MPPLILPPGHRTPLRVLIVEDSTDILESLSAALTMQGIETAGTMRSSSEAIAWLQANPTDCDVIVLDLFLLAGSGLDVLKQLPTLPSPPPVVVLTNYATESLRSQCISLGAAHVFDKSSDIEKMMIWLDGQRAALALRKQQPTS